MINNVALCKWIKNVKNTHLNVFYSESLACKDVRILFSFCLLFLSLYFSLLQSTSHAAKDYVDSDPSGRKGLPITTIKQGAEPPTFTGWFQAWDLKMWETDPLDRIRARFWTPHSRLFLLLWVLTYPTLLLGSFVYLYLQSLSAKTKKLIRLSGCLFALITVQCAGCLTSVVIWFPLVTLSLTDRRGVLICWIQQLVTFTSSDTYWG